MVKWTLIMGTPIVLMTSKNWIFIWSIFELNTFAFISMMDKKKESEEMMKYFLIQSIASIMILLSLNMKMFESSEMSFFTELMPALIILSMALKSGAAPFYLWMPPIIRKITWSNTLLLLSVQKLAPTFLLVSNFSNLMVKMLIAMSIIMGTMLQLTTMNLKLLITYSSVSHLSWMIMSGEISFVLFFVYFMTYSLLLYLIIKEIKYQNMSFILKSTSNISISLNILSFSGIPPLLGFMPKWIIIMSLVENLYSKLFMIMVIMMSCLNIFIYIRIFYFKSLNKQKMKKKFSLKKEFFYSILANFMSPLALVFLPA